MGENQAHSLENLVLQAWPLQIWQDDRVLVAVSGGADSIALLRVIASVCKRQERLFVAHFNHGLRSGANQDQRFVEDLCRHLDIQLIVGKSTAEQVQKQKKGEGLESAARQIRYEFLSSTAKQIGARYVLTAHHADDQIETVLHHIFRGTGISGLRGIQKTRSLDEAVTIVRPLLAAYRTQIAEYLDEIHQNYRHDETNSESQFTRNWIRNELVPLLESRFESRAKPSICRLAEIAGQTESIVADAVAPYLSLVNFHGPSLASVRLNDLKLASPALRREVFIAIWKQQNWPLQNMRYGDWQRILKLTSGHESSAIQIPGGIRVNLQNGSLRFSSD